jgi:hypothetical protein
LELYHGETLTAQEKHRMFKKYTIVTQADVTAKKKGKAIRLTGREYP